MAGETTTGGLDLGKLRIARPEEKPRRRRNPLPVYLLAATAVAACALYGAHVYRTAHAPTVQTITVEATAVGQAGVALTGSGYVVTRHKYITIGTKVLGQIVAEPIQEGQYVGKGELLARIDDRDYQAQLRQAIATREMAEANLRLARAKAERAATLHKQGVFSEDDYETAVSTADVAAATLKSDAAAVDYAQFMVSQCVIRSPIDGVVLQKYREVGDTINYGGALQAGGGATDIAQLADTDDMRAQVDINESDIAKVAIGSAATVVLDAYPSRDFDATLVKIYPEADRQKGTVRVEVHIQHPDLGLIKPEMGAKVSFLAARDSKVAAPLITIPKTALQAGPDGSFVWLVRDGVVHRLVVVRGRELETGVEVKQGLKGGEVIVVTVPANLGDGARVSPAP